MAIHSASEGDTITMLLNDLIESAMATTRARVLRFFAHDWVIVAPRPPRARSIALFKKVINRLLAKFRGDFLAPDLLYGTHEAIVRSH